MIGVLAYFGFEWVLPVVVGGVMGYVMGAGWGTLGVITFVLACWRLSEWAVDDDD